MYLVPALFLLACGNPVDTCEHFPETDCCRTSGECFEYYGNVAAYCSRPDRERGGICSQCLRDEHCDDGETCDIEPDGFGVCLPE